MPKFDAEVISGKLPQKNMRLKAAKRLLKVEPTKLEVFSIGDRTFLEVADFANVMELIEARQRSDYYESFGAGAAIYPRQFWFVDVLVSPRLGINPRMPAVKSSQRAITLAKKDYVGVEIEGQVESEFLFQATTGSELVPFGHLPFPLVVLPVEANSATGGKYRILVSDEAKTRGFSGLKDWLLQVERVWHSKRAEKAERLTVYQWLDYTRKLTRQTSRARFKVLYNSSGTYLVGCVALNGSFDVKVDDSSVKSNGVVAEITTFYCDIDSEDEAHYIVGFLNAPIIDRLVKPMQARGDFGERHIHKKVLELPIPKYEPHNKTHKELSDLAKACAGKVEQALPALREKYDSIGKIRQLIKEDLRAEIAEIDKLAKTILLSRRKAQKLDKLLQSDS